MPDAHICDQNTIQNLLCSLTLGGRRTHVHGETLAFILAKLNMHYYYSQEMATANFQQGGIITWCNGKPFKLHKNCC